MSESQFYQVLHHDPLVVYAKVPWVSYFSPYFETPEPLAILASTNWKLSRAEQKIAVDWARNHHFKFPNHRIEFLLDREDEARMFRDQYELNATLFNPNALCDERVYRIISCPKIFSSVYVARPIEEKRLPLCRDVPKPWLWITYSTDQNPEIVKRTLSYSNVYAPQFKNGVCERYIARDVMPLWLNKAACGLSLSSVEGSNYASAEYLLCGLPVVATEGQCTRTQLFDPRTALMVEATKDSVAAGVQTIAKMDVHPEEVRQITLEKMKPHRERFLQAVRRAYQFVGLNYDPAFDLYHTFRHQMTFWQPVSEVLQGGSQENRELLQIAKDEEKVRKRWSITVPRFWEKELSSERL